MQLMLEPTLLTGAPGLQSQSLDHVAALTRMRASPKPGLDGASISSSDKPPTPGLIFLSASMTVQML